MPYKPEPMPRDIMRNLTRRLTTTLPHEHVVGYRSSADLPPHVVERLAPGLDFVRFPQPRSRRTVWYFGTSDERDKYIALARGHPAKWSRD